MESSRELSMSMFANKADYGVVVHRDDLGGTEISVTVCKVRMGLPGECGVSTVKFDHRVGRINEMRA